MSETKQEKQNIKKSTLSESLYIKDKITGEFIEYKDNVIISRRSTPNKNFTMIFPKQINPIKKDFNILTFMNWLILIARRNIIFMTSEQIAKKYDTTRERIDRIKKKLSDLEYIKTKPGVIFINPYYAWRGSNRQREAAIEEYSEF